MFAFRSNVSFIGVSQWDTGWRFSPQTIELAVKSHSKSSQNVYAIPSSWFYFSLDDDECEHEDEDNGDDGDGDDDGDNDDDDNDDDDNDDGGGVDEDEDVFSPVPCIHLFANNSC